MQIINIDFTRVNQLSKRDIVYQTQPQVFQKFINHAPDILGLKEAIEQRKNYKVNRKLLIEVLREQYSNLSLTRLQEDNLQSLIDENTFTVITAHQPALFTGPLYYVYKIFSVINLCKALNDEFPENKFIPVFINGSEDHDFEEIKSMNIFNKKISWNRDSQGPTGRYTLDGIQECIEEMKQILGNNDNANSIITILESALINSTYYNDFVLKVVNQIFAEYGLLVANMDNKKLKKAFSEIIKAELLNNESEILIKNTQEELSNIGYTQQAYAREINLFYMLDGSRERIIKNGNLYSINNTNLEFTEEEILNELENSPEKFSPNVIIRPLYEEFIFPNIAYIGGGGELAYWMERKSQFEHFNIFFPVLVRRDSALIINKNQADQIKKLGFDISDIFNHEDKLIAQYLKYNVSADVNLSEQKKSFQISFNAIKEKSTVIDKSLGDYIDAEFAKHNKIIEQIENRINRSIKKNEEVNINQIKNLLNKLFPNGGLQERHDNFIQFYNILGQRFFNILRDNLNPLNKNFKVIVID
jgi:bacillithiol biosynthesis cysteine-adding enzyme BshC